MPGSKKGRHAKDGGVAAAVARQVAANKVTNGPISKCSSSGASSPYVQSPDLEPTAVPTQKHAQPAAVTASPHLEAYSTPSISASTAPSSDWTHGPLSGSPGNLASVMGESPPTQSSSYEDPGRFNTAWASPRAYMSPQTGASPSPPAGTSRRRPLSIHAEGAFSTTDTRPQSGAMAYRRVSAASQFSNPRIPAHPPLPHQPQPHFYGVPHLDLDTPSGSGLKAGERGYHFGFDAFPRRPSDPGAGSDTVTVVGHEGGLEVYSVTKRGVDPVAKLKGLRGGVYNAKILPWTTQIDGIGNIFPLVVVVLHGPVIPSCSSEDEAQPTHGQGTTESTNPGSPHPDAAARGPSQQIKYYQTSVEVYSLRTSQRIAVLLEASMVPIESLVAITSDKFSPPPPSGQFSIVADAETIGVTSGTTGECWLYRQLPYQPEDGVRFGCVAKLWTSIQRALKTEHANENESPRASSTSPFAAKQAPIVAINGRWVAYCPPSQSSQISLGAHVPGPIIGKGPGLATVTAPPVPPSTLGTELPASDGIMNDLMRETTQELIHGAKWVGQQGKQAWNAYWSKQANQPQGMNRSPPTQAQQWGIPYSPRQDGAKFPPTHGSPGQAVVAKDTGLVSVVDLGAIGVSSAVHPFASFTVPRGCSFLSFSPTGLSLLSVAGKGDVQTVWDLMRMQNSKASPLQALAASSGDGPKVRQIAQFTRITTTRVVDAAWSKPNGERIAMVTERGTAHLLDMPQSAFTWPPPRLRRTAPESTGSSEPSSSAVSIASSALGAAWGAARPLINRPRRSSSISTGFSGSNIVGSASYGGRAIASSISNSLGKTGNAINNLRQAAEKRISLPLTPEPPTAGCVVWDSGKKRSTIFVAGAGIVRMYSSKKKRSSNWISRETPYTDFNIPSITHDILAGAVRHFLDGDDELYMSDRDMEAGNTVTLDSRPTAVDTAAPTEASIPHAEIESSAPYQPFHTDRRVALHELKPHEAGPSQDLLALDPGFIEDLNLADSTAPKKKKKKAAPAKSTGSTSPSPWAFGQPIPATKLDLGFSGPVEDSIIVPDDHRALPASAMERVMQVGQNDEQIVVTTRKRRSGRNHEPDDDGFFEDDCEVLDFADQRV